MTLLVRTNLLLAGLIVGMISQGTAAPAENWRNYRLAVMQTVVEVAVPYARLHELSVRHWQIPYRAVSLEWIYSGKGPQVQAFDASFHFKGPFWRGNYGMIIFNGFVNKKPEWFKGDLFDMVALKEMVERQTKSAVQQVSDSFYFEVVTINGVPWMHRCDYDPKSPLPGARMGKKDTYMRPLTGDLYIHVTIDLVQGIIAEKLDWLKEAELLRERLKNSLVIKYPAGPPSAAK